MFLVYMQQILMNEVNTKLVSGRNDWALVDYLVLKAVRKREKKWLIIEKN